jgi:hypothetical protein
LTGIALSARSSMKSLTIKSLFEKFSKVKLGPLGKIERPLPVPLIMDAIEYSEDPPGALYYIETCNIPPFIGFVGLWESCALVGVTLLMCTPVQWKAKIMSVFRFEAPTWWPCSSLPKSPDLTTRHFSTTWQHLLRHFPSSPLSLLNTLQKKKNASRDKRNSDLQERCQAQPQATDPS